MEFNDYKQAIETLFAEVENSVKYTKSIHWGLALTEESGEVAKAIKKIYVFNEFGEIQNLKEELGDVLMCLINIAYVNNLSFEEITELNFSKMMSRKTKLINSRKQK